MPIIEIRSLPLEADVDLGEAVAAVTRDFAAGVGVAAEHVSATWTLLAPGHYAVAGAHARSHPSETHPVLVDLLAPDFNSPERIETMLRVAAAAVAQHAGVPETNVFVVYHAARSGEVYDAGDIVRW